MTNPALLCIKYGYGGPKMSDENREYNPLVQQLKERRKDPAWQEAWEQGKMEGAIAAREREEKYQDFIESLRQEPITDLYQDNVLSMIHAEEQNKINRKWLINSDNFRSSYLENLEEILRRNGIAMSPRLNGPGSNGPK